MTLINSLFAKIMPILPRWSVKPFAKPYVAGEKIQDVTNVVKNLNHKGFSATIDILGEFVDSKEEAIEVRSQEALKAHTQETQKARLPKARPKGMAPLV